MAGRNLKICFELIQHDYVVHTRNGIKVRISTKLVAVRNNAFCFDISLLQLSCDTLIGH